MTTRVQFSKASAIELAYALASHVADEAGIRAIAIKGLVTEHYGFRHERPKADVDFLIEPDRLLTFVQLMTERGWRARKSNLGMRAVPNHSVTLYHPDWPCDIDAHWYFPGAFRSATEVFHYLWSRRTWIEIARVPVNIPDKAAVALVTLLHGSRNEHARVGKECAAAERYLRAIGGAEVASQVRAIGAEAVVRSCLSEDTRRLMPVRPAEKWQQLVWRFHVIALREGTCWCWRTHVRELGMLATVVLSVRAGLVTRSDLEMLYLTRVRGAAMRLRYRHLRESWIAIRERLQRVRSAR